MDKINREILARLQGDAALSVGELARPVREHNQAENQVLR